MISEAYVVSTLDKQIVAAHSLGLFGCESLKKSIETVTQFYRLRPGDAIVLNDPSCGGLFPWAITCVLRTETHWIARALPHQMPWAFAGKIDSEGFRIPPTPLVQQGELQAQIFQSLVDHPLAGPQLVATLRHLISLETFPLKNHHLLIPLKEESSHDLALKNLLHELPHREGTHEFQLSTGELIRLKLVCSEEGFSFDFSGTTAGQKCFLSESLVYGICSEYALRFLPSIQTADSDSILFCMSKCRRIVFCNVNFPRASCKD